MSDRIEKTGRKLAFRKDFVDWMCLRSKHNEENLFSEVDIFEVRRSKIPSSSSFPGLM